MYSSMSNNSKAATEITLLHNIIQHLTSAQAKQNTLIDEIQTLNQTMKSEMEQMKVQMREMNDSNRRRDESSSTSIRYFGGDHNVNDNDKPNDHFILFADIQKKYLKVDFIESLFKQYIMELYMHIR
jgi:ClpP class serine protease